MTPFQDFYDKRTLHRWFAVASLLFAATVVWMVLDDYYRPWKKIQRLASSREVEVAQEGLAELAGLRQEVADLESQLHQKEEALESSPRVVELKARIEEARGEAFRATQTYQFEKSELDSHTFRVDEERLHVSRALAEIPPEPEQERLRAELAEAEESYAEHQSQVAELAELSRLAEQQKADLETELKAERSEVTQLKRELQVRGMRVRTLEMRVKENTPRLARSLRDVPLLDFLAPTQRVQQYRTEHTQNYSFDQAERVDRCGTCHVNIATASYADDPTPVLRAHPSLDLYLSDTSPHPLKEHGCSICHRGRNWSTEFARAAHTPVARDLATYLVPAPEAPFRSRSAYGELQASGEAHQDPEAGTVTWRPRRTQEVAIATAEGRGVEIRAGQPAVGRADEVVLLQEGRERVLRGEVLNRTAFEEGTDDLRVRLWPGEDQQLVASDLEELLDQEEFWKKTFGWKETHYWDWPMLSADLVGSSCVPCHANAEVTEDDPSQPRWGGAAASRGHRVLEELACYGCHPVATFPDSTVHKVAPPLSTIASKVSSEWARAWVRNPRRFRENTRMPSFFYHGMEDQPLANRDPEDPLRQEVAARTPTEIASIVGYLFGASAPVDLPEPPEGDEENGQRLFGVRGCVACHSVAAPEGPHEWNFGPNLDRIGNKTTAAWLYAWLRNPEAWHRQTRMPNLRLTEPDAADLAAYLMTLQDPDWEPVEVEADPGELDDLVREVLLPNVMEAEVEERLVTLSAQEKLDVVGEALVRRYGCYGCHDVAAMRGDRGIGVELSGKEPFGSKALTRIDFGFLSEEYGGFLPKTRPAWLLHKLRHPRAFDALRARAPRDLLRMPQFGLTRAQAHDAAIYLLGLVNDPIPEKYIYPNTETRSALVDGRRLVRKFNCDACHLLYPERMTVQWEGETVRLRGLTLADSSWLGACAEDLRLPEETRDAAATLAEGLDDELGDSVVFRLYEPALDRRIGDLLVVSRSDIVDHGESVGGRRFFEQLLLAAITEDEPEEVAELKEIYDATKRASPPHLVGEGGKVQPNWFYSFLKGPYQIRPTLEARMPGFVISNTETDGLVEFFNRVDEVTLEYADEINVLIGGLPHRFRGRVTTGAGADPLAITTLDGEPRSFPRDSVLEEIRGPAGSIVGTLLSRTETVIWVREPWGEYHRLDPDLLLGVEKRRYPFVRIEAQTPGYMEAQEERWPGYASFGEVMIQGEVGNCIDCHYVGGRPPRQLPDSGKQGPELGRVKERIRPRYLDRWLARPADIIPSTIMVIPNWGEEATREALDAPAPEQIRAMIDYLMTFDPAGLER